jgi:uncharacterized RDD family membrane protein YckC
MTRATRLGSMLLDHFVICFTLLPILIVLSMVLKLFNLSQPFEAHPVETAAFYFVVVVYFNKDFIKGRSVAKRLMGSMVVDNKTGNQANEFKCLLRNITIPIWPLEVLVTLISPSRRIGDFIANTRVENETRQDLPAILAEIKSIRLTKTGMITLGATVPIVGAIWYLMDFLVNKI